MQILHTLTAAELHTLRTTVKDAKELLRLAYQGIVSMQEEHIIQIHNGECLKKLQSLELQLGGIPE